jgi:hypothetical protein
MHISQSAQLENYSQKQHIQAIRTERNSHGPKQQPMMESQLIVTHSWQMQIFQSAQVGIPSRRQQIQATHID